MIVVGLVLQHCKGPHSGFINLNGTSSIRLRRLVTTFEILCSVRTNQSKKFNVNRQRIEPSRCTGRFPLSVLPLLYVTSRSAFSDVKFRRNPPDWEARDRFPGPRTGG